MHESNLHHLIADLTIKRGDWDAYMRECEYHGGPQAARVCRARAQAGSGPGLRRRAHDAAHAGAARGLVVHSRYMREEMRAAGFTGPVAVIPHGAWIPEADRNAYRHGWAGRESRPLVGVFGF
jgi:hypothetical protein